MWVYKIGSSLSFTDIIPGGVTAIKETVFPQEATENTEPRFSGADEFTEEPPYEAGTILPKISIPESIPQEPSVLETHLEVNPVIQDQFQPTYRHQPPQGSNPHEHYPLPRGPRPVNPQVVVLEEKDEQINVNGMALTACNGKS